DRLWTFSGQRDDEATVKGVVVATVVIVGVIALVHPVTAEITKTVPLGSHRVHTRHHGWVTRIDYRTVRGLNSPVTLPASVIALFLLLQLAFLVGLRFVIHLVVEGRVRSFRVSKGARDVLIIGGGDGGRLVVRELVKNPQLRLRPVGFLDDDPRKQGMKDEYGLKVLGTTLREDLTLVLDEV